MTDYNVNFTDVNKTPLTVTAENKRVSGIDIEMFGRAFLEYGEQLNENLLHILENFACPENPLLPGNPDVTETVNEALTEPIEGQWWYNTSSETMYFWSGSSWIPLGNRTDYAANWGQIADGGQLPKPVSSITGYVFPYEECIWSVAPALFDAYFDWMACVTDSEANVTMKYRYAGEETPISGNVNYLIIGIKGNNNNGVTPIPVPSPTPSEGAPSTPTPTPTTTVTPTITITPTISLTPSVTPSVGSSPTPTPTKTATPTPTPTRSATPTPSEDVTPSPTPSNTPSPTPSVTPTSSPIPPTPTPTSSPEYDPLSASWAGGNSNAYAAHLVGVPNCLNPVGPGSDSESVTMNVTGGSGDYTIVVDEGSGAEQCNGSGSGNSTTTTTYSIGSNSLVLTAGITWNGHCTDKSRILVIDITITDNVTLEEVLLSGTAFAQVYIGLSGGNNCP